MIFDLEKGLRKVKVFLVVMICCMWIFYDFFCFHIEILFTFNKNYLNIVSFIVVYCICMRVFFLDKFGNVLICFIFCECF